MLRVKVREEEEQRGELWMEKIKIKADVGDWSAATYLGAPSQCYFTDTAIPACYDPTH